MKILFINQYYWPDFAATSQIMGDLAEHLAKHSHEVHVLCSGGQYDSGTGSSKPLPKNEEHHSVHSHRLKATGFGKKRMIGRIADYLSFHAAIGLGTLLRGWKYDVIITLTTPPLVGLYGTPITLFSRTKHVTWVMDLHPDCEFELGLFSRKALGPRLLDYLNGLHFRKADANVVLGKYMGRRLEAKRVAAKKIHVIPVWGHEQDGKPLTPDAPNPLREELGLQNKVVFMYSGNAGILHTFESMCEAALKLRNDSRIAFLFVGGGRRMAEIAAFKLKHSLDNIVMKDYFPREKLRYSLALGDVHLISLRPGMAGVAVPSKLYGIMAAARSMIFVGPTACESADAILAHQCGRVVDVNDVEGLINTMLELAGNEKLRRELGENSHKGFAKEYSPAVCCEQWRMLIETFTPRK